MLKSNPKLTQHRKGRGFTLIELMVTVLILGILTSVALPSFKEFITNQRIKTASFDLMSMMIFARSEAIKRNTDVTLNSPSVINAFTVAAGATVLRQQEGFTGLTLNCKTVTGPSGVVTPCPAGGIIYTSSGRLSTAYLPLELGNTASATSSRCITIDLSGRPYSKKGAC